MKNDKSPVSNIKLIRDLAGQAVIECRGCFHSSHDGNALGTIVSHESWKFGLYAAKNLYESLPAEIPVNSRMSPSEAVDHICAVGFGDYVELLNDEELFVLNIMKS